MLTRGPSGQFAQAGRERGLWRKGDEQQMAIENHRDLAFYEMSVVRDAERAAGELLDLLASRVQDDRLARPLQAAKEDSARHLHSIDGCLQTLGVAVLESRSDIVEGIRRRYETFLTQQPSEQVVDPFTAGTALRLLDFYVSGYRTLVDWSSVIDEHSCVQCFKNILTDKQKIASELDQFSHDIVNERKAPA